MVEKSLTEQFAEALNAAGYEIDWDRLKEIVEALEKAFDDIGIMARAAINALSGTVEEITEIIISEESRARRRKLGRDRAQAIEQRYRAEIRRAEQVRFYRRIYKPPESKNRRNEHETRKSCSNIAVL